LGAWKNATGLDMSSVAVNPQFGAWDDYHTCNLTLDGNGTPLGYTHDVDGEIRNMMTPDIGADEFFNATTFSLGPDVYKCANDSVVLGLSSVGPGTYFWSTFENTPTITVSQAGIYELFLVGSCNSGVDTVEVFDYPLPTASFSYTNSFMTYLFTNTSTGTGATYSWNFGDGNTSSDVNPIHLYSQSGTYTVTLTVTDTCGNIKTSSQTINVVNVGLDALEAGFELYPNPTEGLVLIHIPNAIESAVIEVSDLSGRVLRSESIQNAAQPLQLNLTTLSAGTYVVTIREGSQVWTARVLKH
jgi:PKD repeat protein